MGSDVPAEIVIVESNIGKRPTKAGLAHLSVREHDRHGLDYAAED